MSTTDRQVAWIELVGQLTAMLITALHGSGQGEQATQLEALAHGDETWHAVLLAAQGGAPTLPAE